MKIKQTIASILFAVALTASVFGQAGFTAVMVNTNGVVQRPTNFWGANILDLIASTSNPYATNPAIQRSGTNLTNNDAATVVISNVNTDPRIGFVSVMFENASGLYSEAAQFAFATSGTDARIAKYPSAVSPTNKIPMTAGAERSGTVVTLSFTNENTNAVNWRIWVFARPAP